MLIRIYGDSLSMPRVSEGVPYLSTYGELLVCALKDHIPGTSVRLYNRALGNASIERIQEIYTSDAFYFGRPGGDLAVLQCGIVDCAPRPLPIRLRSMVSRLPTGIRNSVISFIHHQRANLLNFGLSWKVTPPDEFRQRFGEVLQKISQDFHLVCVINIAPTLSVTEAHSPGLSASINLYNEIIFDEVSRLLKENVRLLDVFNIILRSGVDEVISKLDGHHINANGHRLYADAILNEWYRRETCAKS